MPSHLWLLGAIVASVGAHVPSASGSAQYPAAAAYVREVGEEEGGAGSEPYPPVDEAPSLLHSDDAGPPPSPTLAASSPPGKGRRPPVHHREFNAYFRWLWWLIVLYFFWAQAEVCDEYFVPTIEVICDLFGIPEDVAGATIMALGCNGPELFINTVALFKESDLGVGAVVGGEVFNILVLCGAAVLVTPREYMPLQLSKLSFSRDVLFYALSVGLLYWAMADDWVGLPESVVLLASGGVYSAVVANSETLRRRLGHGAGAVQRAAASPAASPRRGGSPSGAGPASFADSGQLPATPEEGCVLRVRALYDNRLVDRSRRWDRRFFRLGPEGLLVSTDVRPAGAGRTARGIVFEHGDGGQGGAWHHGGLVNAPTPRHGAPSLQWTASSFHGCLEPAERAAEAPEAPRRERPAAPDSPASGRSGVGRAASDPEVPLQEKRWEVVPLQDVVACRAAVGAQSSGFELQVLQRGSDVFAKVVRLELDAPSAEARKAWVAALGQGMQAARGQAAPSSNGTFPEAASVRRRPSALREWMDWLRFPVQFLLRVTVPDVKRPAARRWYPLAFLMSMAWLAVFSFCVVEICDIIHDEFGISVTILGFTLAAIGTSFPNVISCIAVSRQGRTTMAIANALGANIQNVFLALALPWTIHVLIKGGPFRVPKTDLNTSVVAMVVTLVLLVGVVLAARCRMPRWTGAAFLVIYAAYLVVTIGQDLTCSSWPLPC